MAADVELLQEAAQDRAPVLRFLSLRVRGLQHQRFNICGIYRSASTHLNPARDAVKDALVERDVVLLGARARESRTSCAKSARMP